MVYTSWSMIPPIGQKTVISLSMLLCLTPSLLERQPFGNGQVESLEGEERAYECPLIGVYTVCPQGVTRFYTTYKDLPVEQGVVYQSKSGKTDFIYEICELSKSIIADDELKGGPLPGELETIFGKSKIYTYTGLVRREDSQIEEIDFGFLLLPGSKAKKMDDLNTYEINFKNKLFKMNSYLSNECQHIKCIDLSTNKVITHFSYYLTYDVDPDPEVIE